MKSSVTLLLAALALCVSRPLSRLQAAHPEAESQRAPIYIVHVTVIDTEAGRELKDHTVVISGDQIAEVKKSEEVKPVAGARIVDGNGRFLIPGLWDMHVHSWNYESTYPLYIVNGVTGVRDMFGPPNANRFRSELAKKELIAPHMYLASPIVDGDPPRWPNSIVVNTSEDARRAVDEQKQKGADFIKIYDRLPRDAYFAIMEESRRQDISVAGHVPFAISAWEAATAKQKSIEHLRQVPLACSIREQELWPKVAASKTRAEWIQLMTEADRSYSPEKCQRLFAELKKNGTWVVPTITVGHALSMLDDPRLVNDRRLRYFAPDYRKWLAPQGGPHKTRTAADFAMEREGVAYKKKVVGAMFRAGVPMLAGTDSGNPYCFPGFSLHDELALLVESGLPPLAALQSATRNAAIFMNATDRYGTVSKDKIADLVLLDADPLADIRNTTKIHEVFLAGREFDRTALDEILKQAESAANQESPATAAAGSLSGKMAMYNPLLGKPWTCTAGIPAMSGQPAHTEMDKVTFSVAPQNVLEIRVSSQQFAGRNFIGFDTKSNQYWRTEMGVFGGIMRETSADGMNFSGQSTMDGKTWEQVRSVLTTVQADGSSSDTEWWTRNGTEFKIVSRCTR